MPTNLDYAQLVGYAPLITAFLTGVGVLFAAMTVWPNVRKLFAEKAQSDASRLLAQVSSLAQINERLLAQVGRLEDKLIRIETRLETTEAHLDRAESEIERLIGLLKRHGIPYIAGAVEAFPPPSMSDRQRTTRQSRREKPRMDNRVSDDED